MKASKYTKVSIQIMLLFISGMVISLIPDYLHSFFGDWYCATGSGKVELGHAYITYPYCQYTSSHIAQWHWGYRHWLFFFMGWALAIVQAVKIVETINKD